MSVDREDPPPLRVLVTGGGGFVGSRLLQAIAARRPNWSVCAPGVGEVSTAGGSLDITDAAAVSSWIADNKPDIVAHLAAVSAVATSVAAPRQTWAVNLEGTLNIVLALKEHAPQAHLLYISSAEVYGASFRSGTPLDESARLQPLNPYAASKAAADILVRQVAAEGLSATIMRPFNHTGAGQSEAFVAPSFAAQIARIEAGLQPPVIRVGSLREERDFLDVGDVIDAYMLAMDSRSRIGNGDIFNVSSGRAVRIEDVLNLLLSQARLPIQIEADEARYRRASIPSAVGDSSLLRRTLTWQPRIPLRDTLLAILQEHRSRLKGPQGG